MRQGIVPATLFVCVLATAPAIRAQAPPAPEKAGGKAPAVTVGGLVQVQAEAGDRGDSRFGTAGDRIYLRRVRLSATARFFEEFDVRVEGEFAGSLSPAVGSRAQLTDGYLNWNRYPQANVRLGQFKTPFGYEQLYSDARLPLIERALVSDRLTLARQAGIQVAGDFSDKRWGYAFGLFNGNGTNASSNDDDRFATVGRGWARLARGVTAAGEWSVSVGANGYQSEDKSVSLADLGFDQSPTTPDKDSIFAGERSGAGFDAQLVVGPVELWAEVFRTRFEPDNSIPRKQFDAEGQSVLATWTAIPDRLHAVVRYENFDPFSGLDDDETSTWTLGGSWFLKGHDLKLMANVLSIDAPLRDREERYLLRAQAVF